jgi:hypothetical protein
VSKKIIDNLLFGLRVEASDIEGDQFELLPVGFHLREITSDSRPFFVWRCVSMAFPALSSTPTIILVFLLNFLFILRQLISVLLLFPRCLTDHWQSCRDSWFRSPLLLFRNTSMSILVLGVVVSSLVDILLFVLRRYPVSSLGCSHILVAGLAQMGAFLLFLCCSVLHVSIFAFDVSLLRLTGVFGWLWDISHLVCGILLISCHISECIPLLLLCFLHFWTRNVCWDLVLYSFRLI